MNYGIFPRVNANPTSGIILCVNVINCFTRRHPRHPVCSVPVDCAYSNVSYKNRNCVNYLVLHKSTSDDVCMYMVSRATSDKYDFCNLYKYVRQCTAAHIGSEESGMLGTG